MDLRLGDRLALVTGSTGGIGEGIAKALAREGAVVVVHGRNEARAQRVAEEISIEGGKAYVATGDLSTDEGAGQVAQKVLSVVGGVDILINNAGAYENRRWADAAPEGWAALYNQNVLSAVRRIGQLVPQMKERGWGRLIQLASGEATQPFAFMPDYAATKAALVNLTVSLAKELAETGVTANTVSPGIVVTKGVERFYRQTAEERGWGSRWEEVERRVLAEILYNPTGRLGRAEDVANLVAYLASPLSGYVNGANYRVDGGSATSIN